MDGILIVDKPSGPTSHDVVSRARRALNEKKIGHTGTLDPTATGVLPLVLGRATKLARYFSGGDKSYRATILLGVTTTTLDAAGEVLETRPVTVSEADVHAALDTFRGDIDQIPPMYSAKKQDGKRLYELARQGVEVEREPKKVSIRALTMVSCNLPEVVVDVTCSAGTYVRVLAQDLGEALGCGGHLTALRRTAAGAFVLDESITLEELMENPAAARERIIPITRALRSLPRIDLPPYLARMIASGYQLSVGDLKTLDTPELAADQAVVLGVDGGDLIAVARTECTSAQWSQLRRDACALKTERVLSAVSGGGGAGSARER